MLCRLELLTSEGVMTTIENVAEPGAPSRWSLMDRLFQLGCAIIVSSALLAVSKDRLLKLLSPSFSREYLSYLLGIVLLITVVLTSP
jgi:hypothetical protein